MIKASFQLDRSKTGLPKLKQGVLKILEPLISVPMVGAYLKPEKKPIVVDKEKSIIDLWQEQQALVKGALEGKSVVAKVAVKANAVAPPPPPPSPAEDPDKGKKVLGDILYKIQVALRKMQAQSELAEAVEETRRAQEKKGPRQQAEIDLALKDPPIFKEKKSVLRY